MKKLLSTLLVVVFVLSSLGLTAFAADDYTAQHLGEGFTRLNLTNPSFEAGVERTFTVTIPEDGDYAVFIGNPDKVDTIIESTIKKGTESKYVSRNWHYTGAYTYVRLGCPKSTTSGAVSSVSLTAGEWTLAIKTTAAMTVPYIDIRQVSISVDGAKPMAIYPMDAYAVSAATNLSGYINDSHVKASSDYTYYGNLESDALSVKKTNHGVLRVFAAGGTVNYRINVKNPGIYKISSYGRFRKTASAGTEQTGTVNMTVGANAAVTGNHTFAAATAVNGWSGYVSVESTVELQNGVTDIVFEKPAAGADWYINYVTVDRISDIPSEEPEIPDVPVDPEKPNDFPLNRTSSYLTAGMTTQLTAEEDNVVWSTSNKEVAVVSADGLVTAVAPGEAYIAAITADGKTATCDVNVIELNVREHQTVPTPDVNGGKFLTDLFDKNKFKAVLTFDNTAEDVTGNVNTTVMDTLTYDSGYHGRAASFANGYVELTDATLGSGSMTVSTWVKTDSVTNREFIVSTCPLNPSANLFSGFYTAVSGTTVELFYIKKDAFRLTSSAGVGTDAPSDIHDGWVNLTWVFDREKNSVYTYVDYEKVKTDTMYAGAVWDGEWAPMLGRGKTKDGVVLKYDGLMDDFFIYDGAMTEADLQKLKNYYHVGMAVPLEEMSLNTKNLSLDINETSTLGVTIVPADATVQDIVWTTSDASVATVNNKGKVRGISQGTAMVTATTVDGGFIDTCSVTVSNETAPFEYDRVCIIGIDGAGVWLDDNFMPNVQRIFGGYATTNDNRASLPSISATNWTSILHGVGYEHHRLNNFIAGRNQYPMDSPYPSIFRVLREADPDAVMASFSEYATINTGIVENGIGVVKEGGSDEEVHEKVLNYLSENDPKLMFIQYCDVDHIGHQKGYGPDIPEYVDIMSQRDVFINEVYEAYEEQGRLDTTLFILCTDHGGVTKSWGGDHGANTPEEVNKYLGLSGPGVQKNSVMGESTSHDVAAIAAHALGLERPETWTGKVPDGAFEGISGDTRNAVPLPLIDHRDHINTSTPKAEGTHLTDIFGKENFAALLEFDDDSAKDVTGNNNTTVNNTLAYEEGFFGKGADFSKGSVTLEEIELGSNDITIGMWMKTDGFTGTPLLVANKEYATLGDGFFAFMNEDLMTLNVRNDSTSAILGFNYLYKDYKDGWTHILLVFDKTTGYMKSYIDFRFTNGLDIRSIELPIASSPITIGSDGDANHSYPLTATLDDVFIYNGAMSEADIAKLQAYYSKEGTEIKLTDVKFEDTVSFDYTLNGDKTDATIYAAVYDENMKLIDVKKLPALLGGYGIENASDAKYLKAFVIDSNFAPKSVPASATKN